VGAIDDEINDARRTERGPDRQGLWSAIISTDATDLSDLLFVTIPAFSPTLRYGPCRWQARSDTALPNRGDKCVVQWASSGELWITAWWPF
jgi:hypothetical protein